MQLAALLLATFLSFSGDEPKDVVALNAGQKVEGRVVYQDDQVVVLRVGSRDREFARKEVASVVSRAATHGTAIDRWLALAADDATGLAALMRWCQESGLREDSELFAWRLLAGAPRSELAHELLGHERKDVGWIVRDGAKRLSWDRLLEVRKDWNDAWELDTTHYRVHSNLKLGEATDVALTLECLYKAFFELFASDVRIYEVLEPMRADVHGDRESFPELTGANRAYFDPVEHKLIIDASTGFDAHALLHEATHQLLDATALYTRGARGEIPTWLNEGLAEYMAFSVLGSSGRFRYDPGARGLDQFRAHAQSKDAYDLSRILTFDNADYLASKNMNLKYAQSYTLVHFLMHGREGKYRKGFMAFLRAAYKGQSSMTEFWDAVEVGERAFEKDWIESVKQIAATK
jgi:hypothetical protein